MDSPGAWHLPAALAVSYEVFCTSETFSAVCGPGHVVVVRRALYGRLSASRCITSEYTHALGCYADVTSHVIDACSGGDWRQNCTLLVATVDAIAQPCGKDFKSYLDIDYDCMPVAQPHKMKQLDVENRSRSSWTIDGQAKASFTDDCTHGNVTILTETEGYLALFTRPPPPGNGVRDTSGRDHGSKPCPWLLMAETGKRFNVSWRLPAAMSPFGGPGAFHGHHDGVEGGFDSVNVHHQEHLQASVDDDDVIDEESSFPVVAVCSATWKIIDGAGISTAPAVSQFAACRSGVAPFGGRMLSSGSGGSQPPQPLHADRAYFSTSNRIEIRFTGSMEALAAAEESGSVTSHRGQGHGRQTGHASPGGGTDDGTAAMQKATQRSAGHRTNAASNERSSALPLAILHYKVIGCTDIVPPEGAFVSRHLDSAAIICNQSAETWYITCRDGRWSGYVGNCTTPTGEQPTLKPTAMSRLQLRFENGIVVAILIGITLGTIAGAVLLGIVFNINRKSGHKHGSRSAVRRVKCKEPYASVSAENCDVVKNVVSGTCRHHASSSLSSTSRRFDDVIYPALLFDDRPTATMNRFDGHPTCLECACTAVAGNASLARCVEFSASAAGPAGDATGSDASLADATGPPSIGGSPSTVRVAGGHRLQPSLSSAVATSACRPFPVPVVPPPLLRVVRPTTTATTSSPPYHRRHPLGVGTPWNIHQMAALDEAGDDCRETPGLFWRLSHRQAAPSSSVESQSVPKSNSRVADEAEIAVSTATGVHFARYHPQQHQQQIDCDVSVLADSRSDDIDWSTTHHVNDLSVVYRI